MTPSARWLGVQVNILGQVRFVKHWLRKLSILLSYRLFCTTFQPYRDLGVACLKLIKRLRCYCWYTKEVERGTCILRHFGLNSNLHLSLTPCTMESTDTRKIFMDEPRSSGTKLILVLVIIAVVLALVALFVALISLSQAGRGSNGNYYGLYFEYTLYMIKKYLL